jgi:hypothetical protein
MGVNFGMKGCISWVSELRVPGRRRQRLVISIKLEFSRFPHISVTAKIEQVQVLDVLDECLFTSLWPHTVSWRLTHLRGYGHISQAQTPIEDI